MLKAPPMNANEWDCVYRSYPKNRAIQIKPSHDKINHFSIVWAREKGQISESDFDAMDKGIRNYLHDHGGKLTFRIVKACMNCTYGHFDREFEDLIKGYRAVYHGIFAGKDLPLDDQRHQHLKAEEAADFGPDGGWTAENPIIFHIHSRSNTQDAEKDARFSAMMRSERNTVITLNIIY